MILNFNDLEFKVRTGSFYDKHALFVKSELDKCTEYFRLGHTLGELETTIAQLRNLLEYPVTIPDKDIPDFAEMMYQRSEGDVTLQKRYAELAGYAGILKQATTGSIDKWGYEGGKMSYRIPMDIMPAFTQEYKFGTLYIDYPHTGKSIVEIINDKDYDINTSSIVPQYLAKANFFMWMGDDVTEQDVFHWSINAKQVFDKMRNSMPYNLHDAKTAKGHLPFADLSTDINKSDLLAHLKAIKEQREN